MLMIFLFISNSKHYSLKMRQVGDPRASVTYDEYNGWYDQPPCSVLTHRDENPKTHGRLARCGGGRRTWTGAVCFGPVTKGYAGIVFKDCPKETLDLINRDFGHTLKAFSNATGSVHGATHVHHILPGLIAPSVQRTRNLLNLHVDHPVLFKEDMHNGHIGDACTVTKEVGLKRKREDGVVIVAVIVAVILAE